MRGLPEEYMTVEARNGAHAWWVVVRQLLSRGGVVVGTERVAWRTGKVAALGRASEPPEAD